MKKLFTLLLLCCFLQTSNAFENNNLHAKTEITKQITDDFPVNIELSKTLKIETMSGTLNKVMLIGHLGDEVKLHHFDGGGIIGRFPLATNETYTNKQTNERVTNTEWHNIIVRNKLGEICEKYLSKGDKVYIEGRLKTRKWTDKDGFDKYSTEVQAVEMKFITTKNKPESDNASPAPESPPKEDENDDLPF